MAQALEILNYAGHRVERTGHAYVVGDGARLPIGEYRRLHAGPLAIMRLVAGGTTSSVRLSRLTPATAQRVLTSLAPGTRLAELAVEWDEAIPWDAIPSALLAAADMHAVLVELRERLETTLARVEPVYERAQNAINRLSAGAATPQVAAQTLVESLDPFVAAVREWGEAVDELDERLAPTEVIKRWAAAGTTYMLGAATHGTRVHALLEAACEQTRLSGEWQLDWDALAGEHDATTEELVAAQHAFDMLGEWLGKDPTRIIATEALALLPALGAAGSPDLVVIDPRTEALTVVDWKTQRSADPIGWWSQLGLYAVAPVLATADDVLELCMDVDGKVVPVRAPEAWAQLLSEVSTSRWPLVMNLPDGRTVPVAERGVVMHIPRDGDAHRYATASWREHGHTLAAGAYAIAAQIDAAKHIGLEDCTEVVAAKPSRPGRQKSATSARARQSRSQAAVPPAPQVDTAVDAPAHLDRPETVITSRPTAAPDQLSMAASMRLRAVCRNAKVDELVAIQQLVERYGGVANVEAMIRERPQDIRAFVQDLGGVRKAAMK